MTHSFAPFSRQPLPAAWQMAFVLLLAAVSGVPCLDAARVPRALPAPRAAWVEPDFPFFSSVLDARKAGSEFPADNLTPRGIVLNLGGEAWACFDVDLLRIAAIWRGKGVTSKALAPGSYLNPGRKTPGGQTPAPEPDGMVWLANGIYPGWQTGASLSLADPREPAPSPEEVGRGALPESIGRFEAVRQVRGGVVLEYTVASTPVHEWVTVSDINGRPVVERHFRVGASPQPLRLVVGTKLPAAGLTLGRPRENPLVAELGEENSVWTVRIRAHKEPIAFSVALAGNAIPANTEFVSRMPPAEPPAPRWPQDVTTSIKRSTAPEAYVVDNVALPLVNPWRRGIRPADIQFLQDGTGVVVTLDGDVWLVHGLREPSQTVRWKRFASGLHEPMTCAVRDDEIYVFDKNGIWRLRDTNGDREADVHEMFSNAFAQTADMREFPATLRLAPGGEFVIAKGGQQDTTLGKHNGSVLRISADGRRSTILGYGFRQPSIGVNVRTGLVTASDQQGGYIPSTPLHIVRDGQFYGFLARFQPREQYPAPPAEPLTWIPHAVNSSSAAQIWLFDGHMGPLNDNLVHIGFNRPEIFRVLLNQRGTRMQAAVVSVTRAFEFTPLNGSMNPADGLLYLAGFQIMGWGSQLDAEGGLGRVRYTGAPVTVPNAVVPMDKGVLLRFDVALDPKTARDPASYSAQSWSYRRTYKYGSPHYKEDGTTGQDALAVSAAYLSKDGRSVFVAVPGIKPVMQLRVGWSLTTAAGKPISENAYTTPYELIKFDPKAEGFGDIAVDLTPHTIAVENLGPVSMEEGHRIAQLFACLACHAADNGVANAGPAWKGLYGSQRPVFIDGKPINIKADDAYLRESILEPAAKIASRYEKSEFAMPSFAGVLTDSQIESLILYIKSLH